MVEKKKKKKRSTSEEGEEGEEESMEMSLGTPGPLLPVPPVSKSVSWSETEEEATKRKKEGRRAKARKTGVTRQKASLEQQEEEDPDSIRKVEEEDDEVESNLVKKMSEEEEEEENDGDDDGDDVFDERVPTRLKTSSSSGAGRRMSAARRDSRPSISRQASRYADRRRGEDEAAQAGFERHLARREGARSVAVRLLGEDDGGGGGGGRGAVKRATAEEAFDFFCKDWDGGGGGVPRRKEEGKEGGGEGDENEEPEVEGSDKKKLLTSELLDGYGGGGGDTYEWTVTEPAQSWVVPWARRSAAEKESLFVPSARRADVERKLNAEERPRFAEEEGLYIGERPRVPRRVKNRVENRILHEHERGTRVGERKRWFGRDGRLVALPDPTLRAPTRPVTYEDEDVGAAGAGPGSSCGAAVGTSAAVETAFCPPNLPGPDGAPAGTEQPGLVRASGFGSRISGEAGGAAGERDAGLTHCQLEVDVTSVVFDHHHLFSLEHYLSVRLTESFDSYQQALSRRRDLGLERRLKLLYDAVDELKEKLEICVQKAERDFQLRRLESYRGEIWLVRQQRDEDCAKERAATKDILHLWRDIKELRRRQGYSNTGVKLVIHKVNKQCAYVCTFC